VPRGDCDHPQSGDPVQPGENCARRYGAARVEHPEPRVPGAPAQGVPPYTVITPSSRRTKSDATTSDIPGMKNITVLFASGPAYGETLRSVCGATSPCENANDPRSCHSSTGLPEP